MTRTLRLGVLISLAAVAWNGPLSAQVTLTWAGGTGITIPTTSVAINDTLDITTSADHDFNTLGWTNNGTVNWQAGPLRSGSSGSITNNATWNDSASNTLSNAFGGSTWSFTNATGATYNKSAAGNTTFSVPFYNQGTVNTTAGSLLITNGGSSTGGTFTAGTGSSVVFSSTYTLSGTITLSGAGTVELAGGTLAGTATVNGPLTWASGSLGNLTNGASSTLTIGSSGDHNFNTSALVNNGTVNWTGGTLRSGSSGSITNNATWNDSASNTMSNAFGGSTWSFTNAAGATYNKTAAGTTTISVPFNNQGTVDVTAGTLQITNSGSSNGGTFTAASGSVIDFTSGYTLSGTVTFSGAGTSQLSGGTLAGPATIEGPITWAAGNFGNLTIGTTSTLTISSSADHDFNAASWINNGIVNWTGGPLRSGSSGSITNNKTWNDSASDTLSNAFGGSTWSFTNASGATYNKTAAGTTTISVPFNNQGSVSLAAGTLVLANGGSASASTFTAGTGTTLTFSSGYTISGTVTLAGPGLIQLTGGTLTGGGTIEGPISWVGGSLSSPPVFGATSSLTISGSADHNFNATSWTNNGTVHWTGGPLRSGSSGSITNNKTWDDSASNTMSNAFGGSTWTFTNSSGATYKKTGTGTSTIAIPFTNAGTLDLRTGVMDFTSTLTLQSTGLVEFSLGGGARGTSFAAIDANSSLTLAGELGLRFTGGYESVIGSGDTLTLLTLSAGTLSGAFSNVANGGTLVSADGLGSFKVHYGSGSTYGTTSLVLSDFAAVPEPSTWALLVTGLGVLAAATRRRRFA